MENSHREPRRTAEGRAHSSTRERLLREVEARPEATTSELVKATGMHENTVRGHLERLRADGHIRRARDESTLGRGRPAWRWQTVPPAQLSAYAGLAATLASALGDISQDPSAPARRAGQSWGRQLLAERAGAADGGSTRDLIIEIMREQGFAPDEGAGTVRLRACPLLAAASRNPQVVCAVHEGMIDGIARANDSGLTSTLEPFSLDGACALHLRASA